MFSFDILTFPLSLSPTGRSSDSCKPFFNYMLKVFINSTLIFFFQERPHSLGSFCLSLPDTGSATLPDFNSTSLRQWCHPERLAYFWKYGINSSWDPGKYCDMDTFTCGFQGCVLSFCLNHYLLWSGASGDVLPWSLHFYTATPGSLLSRTVEPGWVYLVDADAITCPSIYQRKLEAHALLAETSETESLGTHGTRQTREEPENSRDTPD